MCAATKKGVTVPLTGTLLVVAAIIFLYMITQAVETKQRTIMIKGELAMSGYNQAEIIKRFAKLGFESISEKAAEDTTVACNEDLLLQNIRRGLPAGKRDITKFTSLIWGSSELQIIEKTTTSFRVKGMQSFTFSDSRIGMQLIIPVDYDTVVESTYFDC